MKKMLYLFLVLPLIFSSCAKEEGCTDSQATNYNADAEDDDGSCTYSLVGVWELTSAKLDGLEKLGVTIGSEYALLYADGTWGTETYSDAAFTDVAGYSVGTYSLPNTSTLNTNATTYSPDEAITGNYNITWDITKINSSTLHLEANYPNANNVYIKKFSKTTIPLP